MQKTAQKIVITKSQSSFFTAGEVMDVYRRTMGFHVIGKYGIRQDLSKIHFIGVHFKRHVGEQ